MTTNQIAKIFVDADDEIIFVVEKILQAPTEKVVVVIPASSAIESSVISMKLMSRQMVDSSKNIVLVSDNPVAKSLATKAHLVVRDKVSTVDKSAWEEAMALKSELKKQKSSLKNELLSARQPEEILEEDEPEVEEPVVEQVAEVKTPDEKEIFAEKPRLVGKEIELSGIPIVAGGDIREFQENTLLVQDEAPIVEDPTKDEEPQDVNIPVLAPNVEKSEIDERRRKTSNDAKKGRFFDKKKKKIAVIILILLFAGFISVFAFSYFSLANVEISVNFNQSEGEFNKTVTVSTKATSIDSGNLIMPGSETSIEETSSGDGVATGKKEIGEFAQGVIDIRNKSKESAVNLSSGQVVVDISTSKEYTITKNVSIPKDEYERDVPIKAKNFGEDYNIEDEQSTFKIEGFNTEQLIGFGFRDITGGTTEEIVVITEEDASKLKKEIMDQLKTNLLNNVKNQIGPGEVFLEGSERFEEVSYKQSIKTGEEAEDFSAEMKMKVIVTKVSEEDVKQLSADIIKDSEKASEEAEIMVEDFKVRNVKVNGSTVTFQLSASGEVNENLDLEEQKRQIGGRTLGEAEAYLESLDQINEVTIIYSPSFIPESIQRIPRNTNRIKFV